MPQRLLFLGVASPRGTALLVAAVLFAFPLTGTAPAQSYFTTCVSETGNNATVILPATASIQAGDRAVEPGDEIAVFDALGRCAGVVKWTGEHVTLTVWGSNEVSEEKDGLHPGEPMLFRLWRASDDQEWGGGSDFSVAFADHRPYLTTENVYAPNRIYVVDSLRFERPLQAAQSTSE